MKCYNKKCNQFPYTNSYMTHVKIFLSCLFIVILVHILEYNRKVVVTDYNTVGKDEIKVILLWNSFFARPDYDFGFHKTAFKQHECPYSNCILTNNKLLMPQHRFNAILFHGFEFYEVFHGKPKRRGVDQLYIFFTLESAMRTPLSKRMNEFYNLTMSYRLDSDIAWPYFLVRDADGNVVAPKPHMQWVKHKKNTGRIHKDLYTKLTKKIKSIAWFVSNCKSMNGRENYVEQLRKYIDVDIYGACGDLTCSLDRGASCNEMLSRDYLFYLSFENSNCKDYVTEKILTPLLHDTVPVIYGGANYSQFLPPHSYIDATIYSPKELAVFLSRLVEDRNLYSEYFWWRGVYTFEKHMPGDFSRGNLNCFCELCRILNEPRTIQTVDIIEWWMGTEKQPACFSGYKD